MTYPSTIETERSLLAAILDESSGYAQACDVVTRNDFSAAEHAKAWEWMSELFAANRPVTIFSLAQAYGQTPEWKQVHESLSVVPPSGGGHVFHFASVLQDRAALRRTMIALNDALVQASKHDGYTAARGMIEGVLMGVFAETGVRDVVHISEAVDMVLEQMQRPDSMNLQRFKTGFETLDGMLNGGPAAGHLVVIAGKSGEGKTTLAVNMLTNMAQAGAKCLMFSLEMNRMELAQRALMSMEKLIPDWSQTVKTIKDLGIYVADNPDRTVENIRANIKLQVMRHGAKVVIVDYLQLIGAPSSRTETRERQVANMSRQLKVAAKESGVLVIALSQLNEEGQLRESRAIEQDADLVLYVTAPDDDHYLWVTKNRHGAKHGNVGKMLDAVENEGIRLWFQKSNYRFVEAGGRV